ncbi:MAG: hypothetical protein AAGA48_00450 [Myxococcota bacterium]
MNVRPEEKRHPSPLALDRYALGQHDPAIEEHVATCVVCRRHLAQVMADPGPVPDAWRPQPVRGWPRWALPALAVAAALVLMLQTTPTPYVGSKGMANPLPTVAVWMERDGSVARWANAPLRPGDAIRLQVEPGGHRHVVVRSGSTMLYAGDLNGLTDLPISLRVDDEPGPETLTVELTGGGTPWSTTWTMDKLR